MSIDIVEKYKSLGLNSSLSPSVDYANINKDCEGIKSGVLKTVSKMYANQHIPVLKHFLYDPKKYNDVHNSSYRDDRSIEAIVEDAYCYFAVDSLNIPYAIMPTHYYLNSIDSVKIITRSTKFQNFIEDNFTTPSQ